MTSKRTKGRWSYDAKLRSVVAPHPSVECSWTLVCDSVGPSDGALIAASPDLLDELRHMVEAYVVTYGEDCPAVERARAAVARAEGRS
jgi:hypothetical protein